MLWNVMECYGMLWHVCMDFATGLFDPGRICLRKQTVLQINLRHDVRGTKEPCPRKWDGSGWHTVEGGKTKT